MAFERFLIKYPEHVGRVVLIQVALSTAEANEAEVLGVSALVARINSRFGSLGFSPVVYLRQDIDFGHYLALLTVSGVYLIQLSTFKSF